MAGGPVSQSDPADDLKRTLLALSPEAFASHHVLDRVPYIFSSRADYVNWKTDLAAGLEVDPYAIIVVGSACLGHSLNPHKQFSAFAQTSDVDVAVISPRHFDEAWRWLRELGPIEALSELPFEKEMLKWHRSNLVFDGTMRLSDCSNVSRSARNGPLRSARPALRLPLTGAWLRCASIATSSHLEATTSATSSGSGILCYLKANRIKSQA